MERKAFTQKDSLGVKGIAILMMIWHHCFLSGRFEAFSISFEPLRESQVVHIALFFKVCVSLFAFVSGYGLYFSFQRTNVRGEEVGSWVIKRLIKTLSNYWVIVVLAWIICTVIDNRPFHLYGFENSAMIGVWNMVGDFFGLSNLIGISKLGQDWWYISAALVYVILLPPVCLLFDKIGCLCTIGLIFICPRICNGFPGTQHFLSFFPIFCFGMIFARYGLFDKWHAVWCKKDKFGKTVLKVVLLFLLWGISYKLYNRLPRSLWWEITYNCIPIVTILVGYTLMCTIPGLRRVLAFLGIHATNIWLIHGFIQLDYCKTFTYSMKHFCLIMAVLLLISLSLSCVIERLKKLAHYDYMIQKLSNHIGGRKRTEVDR